MQINGKSKEDIKKELDYLSKISILFKMVQYLVKVSLQLIIFSP